MARGMDGVTCSGQRGRCSIKLTHFHKQVLSILATMLIKVLIACPFVSLSSLVLVSCKG